MSCFLGFFILLCVVSTVAAQSPDASKRQARDLDAILQDYAYRAFVRPRTGVIFNADPPPEFSGVKLAAMRLRSGSLKRKGVPSYFEFKISSGVDEKPYVERLILVYQNLANWSSSFYQIPGYSFVTPVLGLLAYDAANLSAKNLPELSITATGDPIRIQFSDVKEVPQGFASKCVWFDLNGIPNFSDLESGNNACSTANQGHFCIVTNSSAFPPPPPRGSLPAAPPKRLSPSGGNNSRKWKIAGSVVGGFVGLVLLSLLSVWLLKKRQHKKIVRMEQQSETGEALRMATVGSSRAPVAMGTRTPPVLENEYVP